MATDRDIIATARAGELNAGPAANLKAEITRIYKVGKAKVEMTRSLNTATANQTDWIIDTVPLAQFSNGYRVTDFRVIPFINLTADNTLNVILTLTKYNGGVGGTGTTIATSNTATTAAGGLGDLTRRVPYSCTVNTAASECAANSVLTVSLANAGASAAAQNMAGAVFEVLYEAI